MHTFQKSWEKYSPAMQHNPMEHIHVILFEANIDSNRNTAQK